MKGTLQMVSGTLGLLFVMPIWFYLLYRILLAVNASDLMWFLYVAYIPLSVIIGLIQQIIKAMED